MQNRKAASFQLTRLSLLLLTAILTGCNSLKSPERPAYSGTDTVNTVDASHLIGTWISTELNPYPDNEAQSTTIEYRSDGTVKGTMILSGEQWQSLGDMEFELNGNWAVANDIVTHQNITMRSTSDDALGKTISNIINSRPAISGQANIYEMSYSTMIMVGSDGTAMKYVRQ